MQKSFWGENLEKSPAYSKKLLAALRRRTNLNFDERGDSIVADTVVLMPALFTTEHREMRGAALKVFRDALDANTTLNWFHGADRSIAPLDKS